MNHDNITGRFTGRSANYAKYRPGYPAEMVAYLESAIGLQKNWTIADIGAGTGIFSAIFLDSGYRVIAVEPNEDMIAAAIAAHGSNPLFTPVKATAEQSGLMKHSIDLVTVAQAFHWFDHQKVLMEWKRILRPGAWVLIVWNMLKSDTAFLKEYNSLKSSYGEERSHPIRANLSLLEDLFCPSSVIHNSMLSSIHLDKEGLIGLLLSSSTINLNNYRFLKMKEDIDFLFDSYQQNGLVRMDYDCEMYLVSPK